MVGESDTRIHGNSLLSDQQELALVCLHISFDLVGLPLRQATVSTAAKTVFEVDLSPSWFTDFYDRHEKYLAGRRKRGSVGISNPALYTGTGRYT